MSTQTNIPHAQTIVAAHNYDDGYNRVYVARVITRIEKILNDPNERDMYRDPTAQLTYLFAQPNFAGTGDRGDWLEIERRIQAQGWRVRLDWSSKGWHLTMSAINDECVTDPGFSWPHWVRRVVAEWQARQR